MDKHLVKLLIGDLIITVDESTAKMLRSDPKLASEYLHQIKTKLLHNQAPNIGNLACSRQENIETIPIEDNSSKSESSFVSSAPSTETSSDTIRKRTELWVTKHPTQKDIEATFYFIDLRKKFEEKFLDKKHPKNLLWRQIAELMNKHNFYVGDAIEGAERCRKKFSNLQAAYLKYEDRRKSTGEGKIVKPPFYDELEEIFNKKDKTDPPCIIDSIDPAAYQPGDTLKSENNSYVTESKKDECSRFNTIKDIKPSKNKLLQMSVELQKEQLESRKHEFNTSMNLLQNQADQRHMQIMAMLNQKEKKGKENKKRKHSSSEESD